jgi:hypothetical protein
MKQFRFTREGQKVSNTIYRSDTITYGDFIHSIRIEESVNIVKLIDQEQEDWEVTFECFKYFAKKIIKCHLNGEENLDSDIRDIIDELNKLSK